MTCFWFRSDSEMVVVLEIISMFQILQSAHTMALKYLMDNNDNLIWIL